MTKIELRKNHRWAKANVAVIRILFLLNVTVVLAYIAGITDILSYIFLKRSIGFMQSGILDFFSGYVWPVHQIISLVSAVLSSRGFTAATAIFTG
jgi:hypothetical protein